MKDIKSYIIGFLSATCLFLFMGYTDLNNKYQVGQYQLALDRTPNGKLVRYIFNTKSAVIWRIHNVEDKPGEYFIQYDFSNPAIHKKLFNK